MAMLPKEVVVRQVLDPTECFDLWLELGSLEKVVDHFTRRGQKSGLTGERYTITGVRISAYRWMFDHIPEAYERCRKAGSELSWEEFRLFVLTRYVGHCESNAKVKDWLEKNDFLDPTWKRGYRRVYERKFGRIHAT